MFLLKGDNHKNIQEFMYKITIELLRNNFFNNHIAYCNYFCNFAAESFSPVRENGLGHLDRNYLLSENRKKLSQG